MAVTQFTSTTVHSSSAHNAVHNELEIPAGIISLWYGSVASIPSGWNLCDGSNGTPDLRDRFVIGAGSTYSVDAIGGEATHVLTESEMPTHRHSVIPYAGTTGTDYASHISAATNGSSYDNTGYVGSSQAHNNIPPYYALCYIMKI